MGKIILALAIILGIFFRFSNLVNNPPGLAMDEASFGINAVSMAADGKDEWGVAWPLTFRAFADFKLPAMGYLLAVTFKILGVGVWQLRLVSALAGILTVIGVYLLVNEFLKNKKIAWITAMVALWSPWLVFFSRGAFESNLGLMFFVWGILLLLKGKVNLSFLLGGIIALVLANYSYITYKFLTPLVVLGYLFTYKRKLITQLLIALVLFGVLSSPMYFSLADASGNNRIKSLWKFDQATTGRTFTEKVSANYIAYFSPKNLFFSPDPVRHRHFEGLATFYWFLLPFWLIGIYQFGKLKNKEFKYWLLFWILLSPIPATLSADPFASLRALPLAIPMVILVGLGLAKLNKWGLVIVLLLAAFTLNDALIMLQKNQQREWNYGVSEMVEWVSKQGGKRIAWFDRSGDLYPNILFALRSSPEMMYSRKPQLTALNGYKDPKFDRVIEMGNYTFGPFDKQRYFYDKDVIVIGRSDEMPPHEPVSAGMSLLHEVKGVNFETLFSAYGYED